MLLPVSGFFHLARKFLDALAHDLSRLELYRRSRRNDETAAGLVGISADARFGQARLKDAKVAQLNRNIASQAIGDVIQRSLNDFEDLVLDHPSLITDGHNDVAFGELTHGIADSSIDHRVRGWIAQILWCIACKMNNG